MNLTPGSSAPSAPARHQRAWYTSEAFLRSPLIVCSRFFWPPVNMEPYDVPSRFLCRRPPLSHSRNVLAPFPMVTPPHTTPFSPLLFKLAVHACLPPPALPLLGFGFLPSVKWSWQLHMMDLPPITVLFPPLTESSTLFDVVCLSKLPFLIQLHWSTYGFPPFLSCVHTLSHD